MLLKQLHRVSGYAPSTTVGTTPTRATSSTAAAAADEQLAAITQNKDPTQPADDRISGSSRAAGRETQEARAQTAAAPAECVVLGAAATSTGHVEIFSVRRGTINPLAIEVSMSHAVHKDVVRGVRWIGNCSQLVSFSSEKTSSGAWKNSLVITDVRTGRRCVKHSYPASQVPNLSMLCQFTCCLLMLPAWCLRTTVLTSMPHMKLTS